MVEKDLLRGWLICRFYDIFLNRWYGAGCLMWWSTESEVGGRGFEVDVKDTEAAHAQWPTRSSGTWQTNCMHIGHRLATNKTESESRPLQVICYMKTFSWCQPNISMKKVFNLIYRNLCGATNWNSKEKIFKAGSKWVLDKFGAYFL